MDRALYVFACNRRQCSSNNDGWIVIRDQRLRDGSVNASKSDDTTSNINKCNDKVNNNTSNKTSKWDFLSDNNSNSNSNNNYYYNDDDDDEGMDDLYSLLSARDNALKNVSENSKKNDDNNSNRNSDKTMNSNLDGVKLPMYLTSNWLKSEMPCLQLDEIEDHNVDEICNDSDSDNDDDNILNMKTISDSKVKQLLESYICDEDELEVEVLNQHVAMRNKSNNSVNNFGNSKAKSTITTNDGTNIDNESDTAGGALEKKLSGKDRTSREELFFLKKLSYEPRQVLRYAYEGKPLWCSKPPAVDPLQCNNCGSKRVFEVQLMPALLSYIKANNSDVKVQDQHTSNQASFSSPNTLSLDELLGNDLDFGVVCIFSCPNSCEYIDMKCEECVIVQSQE